MARGRTCLTYAIIIVLLGLALGSVVLYAGTVASREARVSKPLVEAQAGVDGFVARVSVTEGQQVVAGQHLLRLEPDQPSRQRLVESVARFDLRRAEVAAHEAELAAARERLQIYRREALADVATQERRYEQACADLAYAQKDHARWEALFRSGTDTAQTREQAQARLDAARRAVAAAAHAAEQARARQRDATFLGLFFSNGAVRDDTLAANEAALGAKRAELALAAHEVGAAQQLLETGVEVLAPVDGWVRRLTCVPGAPLGRGDVVALLEPATQGCVLAGFTVEDAGRLRLQQPATVRVTDAGDGVRLPGRVRAIGLDAVAQPWPAVSGLLAVEVALEGPLPRLDDPVRVTIEVPRDEALPPTVRARWAAAVDSGAAGPGIAALLLGAMFVVSCGRRALEGAAAVTPTTTAVEPGEAGFARAMPASSGRDGEPAAAAVAVPQSPSDGAVPTTAPVTAADRPVAAAPGPDDFLERLLARIASQRRRSTRFDELTAPLGDELERFMVREIEAGAETPVEDGEDA